MIQGDLLLFNRQVGRDSIWWVNGLVRRTEKAT